MDNPSDICTKYCKQRLQRLTDDKPCPFHLSSVEIEMDGEDTKVHTICIGQVNTVFKTMIDRITRITKKGVEVIKEIIKHESVIDEENLTHDVYRRFKKNSFPDEVQPYIPQTVPYPAFPPPNLPPIGPGYPWTYTTSIAQNNTTIGSTEKTNDI
jgi:hypothetical protein